LVVKCENDASALRIIKRGKEFIRGYYDFRSRCLRPPAVTDHDTNTGTITARAILLETILMASLPRSRIFK
jgi:hypothetical protein